MGLSYPMTRHPMLNAPPAIGAVGQLSKNLREVTMHFPNLGKPEIHNCYHLLTFILSEKETNNFREYHDQLRINNFFTTWNNKKVEIINWKFDPYIIAGTQLSNKEVLSITLKEVVKKIKGNLCP